MKESLLNIGGKINKMYLDLRADCDIPGKKKIVKFTKVLNKHVWYSCAGEEDLENPKLYITQLTKDIFCIQNSGTERHRIVKGRIEIIKD